MMLMIKNNSFSNSDSSSNTIIHDMGINNNANIIFDFLSNIESQVFCLFFCFLWVF